ncbi:MAG: metallopeptidase family protein [Pseudomonadota bacterium]|nr:metallopeptidase family protein [Pseudomonadota bacterium]
MSLMTEPVRSPEIEEIAQRTLERLPAAFQAAAREITLLVIEHAPRDVLEDFGMSDPLELTGLYCGVPLTERSFDGGPYGPAEIHLYRAAIEAEMRDRGNVSLEELVAHITVHEMAHHLGWSDDDIAAIDPWWE